MGQDADGLGQAPEQQAGRGQRRSDAPRRAHPRGDGRAVHLGTGVQDGAHDVLPQPAQHGEHPAVVAVGGRQVELGEDVGDVLLDGAVADDQRGGDGGVGAALGHEPQHLALAGRQPAERVAAAAAGEQLGDDLGVEGGAALAHPAHGVEELGDVGDPVLQQVADARRCRRPAARWRSAPRRTARGRGCRPRASGPGSASAARRPSSVWVGGMRTSTTARSGLVALDDVEQRVGVAHGGHDLLAGVDQQAGQPGSQQHGVLGDHDPHGSSTRRVVGPPAGLMHVAACRRGRRPGRAGRRRPVPRSGSAPPTPSSRTSTTRRSPARTMADQARVACGVAGHVGRGPRPPRSRRRSRPAPAGRSATSTCERDGHGRAGHDGGQGGVEAPVLEDRRVDAPDQVAELARARPWPPRGPRRPAPGRPRGRSRAARGPRRGPWPGPPGAAGRRRAGRARCAGARPRRCRRPRPGWSRASATSAVERVALRAAEQPAGGGQVEPGQGA